ncbi:hypothetical protein BD413DRAFT_534697 [Trametes elegans]|nr:hypothetical protein BD413DRAFT_534697 [Trametes elegans]
MLRIQLDHAPLQLVRPLVSWLTVMSFQKAGRLQHLVVGRSNLLRSSIRAEHTAAYLDLLQRRFASRPRVPAKTAQHISRTLPQPPCVTRQRGVRTTHTDTKVARSYGLPPLPPAPPYPCPVLTEEEIQHFVQPLLNRSWSKKALPAAESTEGRIPSVLEKVFSFEHRAALDAFLQDVQDVTEAENHHADLDVKPEGPAVIVSVHTHTALWPPQYEGEKRRARVKPGLSLRDVRFAMLLEERLTSRS